MASFVDENKENKIAHNMSDITVNIAQQKGFGADAIAIELTNNCIYRFFQHFRQEKKAKKAELNEAFNKSQQVDQKKRLDYLLKQAEIFTHFMTGESSAATKSGKSKKAAASSKYVRKIAASIEFETIDSNFQCSFCACVLRIQ